MQGRIKWFQDAKGFGFIAPHPSGKGVKDVFVHYTGIEGTGHRTLMEGDLVEFDVRPAEKDGKPEAFNVRRIDAFDEEAVSDASNTA